MSSPSTAPVSPSTAPVSPSHELTKSTKQKFTSPNGVEMYTYITYEAKLNVHPDHAGFLVGARGSTIKGVGSRNKVDVKMNKGFNGNWPKVVIRGKMENVENAYKEIQHIANIANQKIPRINPDGSVIESPQYQPNTSHKKNYHHQKKNNVPPALNLMDVANITVVNDNQLPPSPSYTPSSPGYIPTSD